MMKLSSLIGIVIAKGSALKQSRTLVSAIIACLFLVLVACGDDDSDFATRPSNGSSSSVCEDSDDGSSSSVTQQSSSSETSVSSSSENSNPGTSSNETSSSSVESSSSVKSSSSAKSSSSEASSSSVESSSSVRSSSSAKSSSSSSSRMSSSSVSSSSVAAAIWCKRSTVDTCVYDVLIDERDGKKYKTVLVGEQWWMAENLNYETDNSSCYDDADSNCTKYGRLYTWGAAMDSAAVFSTDVEGCVRLRECKPKFPVRGICPEGWHIPDTTEWMILFKAAEDYPRALYDPPDWEYCNSDNDYGFSLLPAGIRDNDNKYYGKDRFTIIWSPRMRSNTQAYVMLFNCSQDGVDYRFMYNGFSVRCIKDED
ncbi:MAG: fibrobacter succinogenes major paralogous domain-containing protein [Fibrobacter sp.]|nr:fibrobacter succinogenes major paralogous domain-containing protein [Fibrobacter sp.]